MKRLALVSLTAAAFVGAAPAALAAPPSHAPAYGYRAPQGAYVDYANVLAVDPVHDRSYRPQRVCYQAPVERRYVTRSGNSAGGTVLGALIGGVLGNTVGHGDGRKAATVAGAVIGGVVGNNVGSRRVGYEQDGYAERCRTETAYAGDRVVAYDVTYRYRGQTFRTQLDHDPGRRMRVAVNDSVRPAE